MLVELALAVVLQNPTPATIPPCVETQDVTTTAKYETTPCAVIATDGSVVVIGEDSTPASPEQETSQEATDSEQNEFPLWGQVLIAVFFIFVVFGCIAVMGGSW